jgi:hypothetical protein
VKNVFGFWYLINIPIFFIIGLGFATGILQPLFIDVSYLTPFIFAYTVLVIFRMGWTSYKIGHTDLLEHVDTFSKSQIQYNLEKLLNFPRFSMDLVVALGFLGTVVGVFIGFQHFPEGAFTDPVKMQEFVRMMLTGFSTELHSLLMGLVCRIWISIFVYLQTNRLTEIYHENV